mmetsp:Transcript_26481/g.62623  ORF Transcript_26481/g.62623 Transcript_26481/m.62623 type:complete len:210 (+) Transcript_26481:439-1068(+)
MPRRARILRSPRSGPRRSRRRALRAPPLPRRPGLPPPRLGPRRHHLPGPQLPRGGPRGVRSNGRQLLGLPRLLRHVRNVLPEWRPLLLRSNRDPPPRRHLSPFGAARDSAVERRAASHAGCLQKRPRRVLPGGVRGVRGTGLLLPHRGRRRAVSGGARGGGRRAGEPRVALVLLPLVVSHVRVEPAHAAELSSSPRNGGVVQPCLYSSN